MTGQLIAGPVIAAPVIAVVRGTADGVRRVNRLPRQKVLRADFIAAPSQ
jgi:hypothetical protein